MPSNVMSETDITAAGGEVEGETDIHMCFWRSWMMSEIDIHMCRRVGVRQTSHVLVMMRKGRKGLDAIYELMSETDIHRCRRVGCDRHPRVLLEIMGDR